MPRACRHWLPKFARSRDGVSAIEFALVLPLLLLILFGGFEFSRLSAIARKVTLTTRAVADLTTQYVTMSDSDVSVVLGASAQIFSPYSTSAMTIVVSQISVSAGGVATVDWSRTLNGTALTQGQVLAIPAAMAQPSSSLIWCTVSYNYVPVVSTIFGPTKTVTDQIYMSPRRSNSITLSG